MGLGHFVTRADLEKMEGRPIAEALFQIQGTRMITSRSHAWLASSRAPRTIANPKCYKLEDFEDYVRGQEFPRDANCLCFPTVYRDRTPLSLFGVIPNVNRFSPDLLEGIEIFASAAQVPPEYATGQSQCGVIVFHSRKSPL